MPRRKLDNGDPDPPRIQRRGDLREDDLVNALAPDPSQIPNVILWAGFLGRSTRRGYWRLYLTAELNDYVEFSEEDIRHHQPIPPEQSPVGGTLVWLDREATIQRTTTASRQAQAEFLKGALIADAQAQMTGSPVVAGIQGLSGWGGVIQTLICPQPQGSIRGCETYGCPTPFRRILW